MATNITTIIPRPTGHHRTQSFKGQEAGKKAVRDAKRLANIIVMGREAIPCSQDFLNDLINKLTRYHLQSVAKNAKVKLMNNLNMDEITMAQLNGVIVECIRLTRHPELFPTSASRDNFVPTAIKLVRAIAALTPRGIPTPIPVHVPVLPHFHPLNLSTGLPWNKWLDNSVIGRVGWIAIQQRIPRIGMDILNNIGAQYDAAQRVVPQMNKNLSIDAKDKLPAYDEPFKHMTWSGFSDGIEDLRFVTHGFRTQGPHSIDFDGSLVLEMYSKWCICMAGRLYRPRLVDVAPYFRWAMAYPSIKA